jgi:hypothetical protein
MIRYLLLINVFFSLCGYIDRGNPKKSPNVNATLSTKNYKAESIPQKTDGAHSLTDFIPKGYIIAEKIYGDLNKDHVEDCVILIKGTNKNKFFKDKYRGELDRNRRGVIVLFKVKNGYKLAVKNHDCFSSENEDGGVYFAPELELKINKGNLYVHYAHGRYGYWEYTLRFQHSDFELIGYDESDDRGPIVNSETSINYLTKRKIVKENTNTNAQTDGEEVFKTTQTKINLAKLIKLSEIKDFDKLDVPGFL